MLRRSIITEIERIKMAEEEVILDNNIQLPI